MISEQSDSKYYLNRIGTVLVVYEDILFKMKINSTQLTRIYLKILNKVVLSLLFFPLNRNHRTKREKNIGLGSQWIIMLVGKIILS